MKLKSLINESMTLYVDGLNYDKNDTLLDLTFKLERIVSAIIERLPEDQKEYFRKNRPPEVVTPDGEDTFKSTGIINIYYSGYTKSTFEQIVKGCIDELKRLGVKVGTPKLEQSSMFNMQVLRLPVLENSNDANHLPPITLQLSNRNAYQIFHNILQFEPQDYNSYFEFTVDELENAVNAVLHHDKDWMTKNQIKSYDSKNDEPPNYSGPRIIDMGVDENYIKEKLKQILQITDWAKKHNKTKLYVI